MPLEDFLIKTNRASFLNEYIIKLEKRPNFLMHINY